MRLACDTSATLVARSLFFLCLLSSIGTGLAEPLPGPESHRRERLVAALASLDQESVAIVERARSARAACLLQWVQSACLESVRQQQAKDERALLLATESLSESIRRIDAGERGRGRSGREEALHAP